MGNTARTRLNETEQMEGRRRLCRFFWLNGIAVTCMMENILLLWALRNGLSAARVAVLASFMFLSMPFMVLGKRLSAATGLVRAWSLCWIVRYLFVLAMIPAPWLRDTALEPAIPWLIMGCTFALFALRSMGMINTVPMIGALADRDRAGSFQAGVNMRSHTSYFGTMLAIMALLRWRDTLGSYQFVLAAGCTVGVLSSFVLRRTPEPVSLRAGARPGLWTAARKVWRTARFRHLALAWCASTSAIALITPISMLALKQGYGLADEVALGFTLLEVLGAMLAGYALTVVSDHTGPQPLLVLGMSFFCMVAAFWAFAPMRFLPVAAGGAFLLAGISKGILPIALNHYFLACSKSSERIGVGMVMQMLSGAASGVAGAVIGGGLLSLLEPRWGTALPLYHAYYRVILILVLVFVVAAVRLPRLKDWAVRDVIGLIFSFNDLRALMTLNRLHQDSSDEEDAARIDDLSSLASMHSEPLLREFIERGRLVPQARAIQALSRIRIGEETERALIRLVKEGAFTNGWRAAEILGQRGVASAIPALREGLRSPDAFLGGKCQVALARLHDTASYAVIRELFRQSANPRIVIHGAHALERIRDPGDIPLLLVKACAAPWPQVVLDELIMAAAAIAGRKREVYRCLRALPPGAAAPAPPGITPASSSVAGEKLCAFLKTHAWHSLPPRLAHALLCLLAP